MSSSNDSPGKQAKKLPPKKWAARIARSRSASSMSRYNAPNSPLRPSPPKIIPPPSSPTGSHKSPPDDGVALPPPSPSTFSSTPKKSWERHYKSFLRGGKKLPKKKLPSPDLQKDEHDSTFGAAPSRKLFGRKHSAGAVTRKTVQLQDQQSSTALSHSIDVAPLPDLSSKPSIAQPKSAGLQNRHKDSGDAAVRGGSLFHSVFHHKNRSGSGSSPLTDEDNSLSVGGSMTHIHRRRIKSVDTLDSAVHKGYDKDYSPGSSTTTLDAMAHKGYGAKAHSPGSESIDTLDSAVHKGYDKAYSPDNARFRNLQILATPGMPPPSELMPPLVKMKASDDDLEGSVRGGVPRRSPQPVKPSLLSQKLQQSGRSPRAKSKDLKVAFTEFHNSTEFAQDSTSAYLGDEPSQHGSDHFSAIYNQRNSVFPLSSSDASFSHRHRVDSSHSLALEPVTEHVVSSVKASSILYPLLGTDTWASGRRYLIAPAAIAMCPNRVMKVLIGGQDGVEKPIDSAVDGSPQQQPIRPLVQSAFGALVLGTASVTYVGRSRPGEAAYGWTTCSFVLRQNYFFEYAEGGRIHEMPRGFCHLQYSTCVPHENFHDTLELQFYGSPCAKADQRTLMIRVKSEIERDRWVSCLTAAAKLKIEDLYEFDESTRIGDGQYARVLPARKKCSRDSSNIECALKVIDKKEFWYRVQNGRERADTLVREATVQSTISVECGLLSTFLQSRGFFETCEYVVMELELAEGKDLFRYMSDKGVLSEREAAHIMKDLLTSIDAMHHIGVAHRDIKPANLLMCEKENSTSVKLGDYGMSTLVGVDGLVRGRCGTPGYVAPEIFIAGVHSGYRNKVDVFSAGVTLYIMLSGYEPFYGESESELIAANREAHVEFDDDWNNVSSEAIDLITKMLEPDPQKRIDASAALHHPWITSNVQDKKWSNIHKDMHGLALTNVPNDTACTLS